jgi:2-dehydropantoate 2-reductase
MEKLNILVFGAGAIGTYVGGSLAISGNRVTFLEQSDAVKHLRTNGLRLELRGVQHTISSEQGSVHFAASLKEALSSAPFDFAIYALKSFDTAAFLASIGTHALNLPPVLCLSNGVDNETDLAAVFGADGVIAGTVTSSVGRSGVGQIVLERLRGVGITDGHPLSLFIQQSLNAAGLNARMYARSLDMKWSKMLTNLPANASAAILNMTAGEVFSHPGLFRLEMRMLRETLAVMRALGIRLVDLPGTPVRLLGLGVRLPEFISRPLLKKAVGGGRGGKMPSFHIDLHSGRGKSEVEWLNGAVVRHGNQVHVPAPVNELLTRTLMSLTRGEIPLETYARQPEKLLALIGR